MIKVKIRVYATLKELFETSPFDIQTSARTVGELIDAISNKYNARFKELLIDQQSGKVQKYYKILLNGRDIDFLNGLDAKIENEDIVAFFPPVGGGSTSTIRR